jgi:hypothetical protein
MAMNGGSMRSREHPVRMRAQAYMPIRTPVMIPAAQGECATKTRQWWKVHAAS